MNKQEILEKVLDYINNEKAEYAVLIDGPWGSGKEDETKLKQN